MLPSVQLKLQRVEKLSSPKHLACSVLKPSWTLPSDTFPHIPPKAAEHVPAQECHSTSWTFCSCGCGLHQGTEPLLPGLLAFSSLEEGAIHSKLERKSISEQMSKKDYNEESAESGTVWGKRYERMGEPETGGWLPVLSAKHTFLEPGLGIFIMQYQRAVLCHPGAPCQILNCAATVAVLSTATLKNWPEAKALQCWRAWWSPWGLLGLLLPCGGQDHQEGLLCTTALDPEKECPCLKSQEWLSNRDPGSL